MPLHGPYVQHGSWTASLRCSASFIGHTSVPNGSSSSSLCSPSVACMSIMAPPRALRRRAADVRYRFSTATVRSGSALELNVPATRRVVVGNRAFVEGRCGRPSIYALGVTEARVWNGIGTVCRLTSSSRHRFSSSSDKSAEDITRRPLSRCIMVLSGHPA